MLPISIWYQYRAVQIVLRVAVRLKGPGLSQHFTGNVCQPNLAAYTNRPQIDTQLALQVTRVSFPNQSYNNYFFLPFVEIFSALYKLVSNTRTRKSGRMLFVKQSLTIVAVEIHSRWSPPLTIVDQVSFPSCHRSSCNDISSMPSLRSVLFPGASNER